VLRLLAASLRRLRDAAAARDDADGVARFARLERLVHIDHDHLVARATLRQAAES
jgi:hypothetical protein